MIKRILHRKIKNAFKFLCLVSLTLVSCNQTSNKLALKDAVNSKNSPLSILKLFNTKQIVGIGEYHYVQEFWDAIEKLIAEPDFPNIVRNIGFEGGNCLYQNLMDKYVMEQRGTESEIKQTWRNNTQINTTFDAPVYLRMINQVREINKKKSPEKRIRIILLDPPINWKTVTTERAYDDFLMDRESNMDRVMEKEVYAKNQTALLIAGTQHILRNRFSDEFKNALSTLENNHPGTTFAIGLHASINVTDDKLEVIETKFSEIGKPSLIDLKNSEFGKLELRSNDKLISKAGTNAKLKNFPKLNDIYDALLFVGKKTELTTSDPSLGICTGKPEDDAWKKMIIKRQQLVNLPPFLRINPKTICTPLPKLYFKQDSLKMR